jgi:hypothetical protein
MANYFYKATPTKGHPLIRPLPPKVNTLVRPFPPKVNPLVKADFRCTDIVKY